MTPIGRTINAYMTALETLFQGASPRDEAHSRVLYLGFEGWDEPMMEIVGRSMIDTGLTAIIGIFDGACPNKPPLHIGAVVPHPDGMKLQFGRLWVRGARTPAALLASAGEVIEHYTIERTGVVEHAGWPAAKVDDGIARASRALARLALVGAGARAITVLH